MADTLLINDPTFVEQVLSIIPQDENNGVTLSEVVAVLGDTIPKPDIRRIIQREIDRGTVRFGRRLRLVRGG